MPTDSIDTIKRRMIRNASRIWGYQDVQDINSFDPVLSLLIGAIAEELHNVSRDINKTDARVVEKLLGLIFNQNIFSHFPAHAVVYAKPYQSRVTINEFYQFYFNKSIQNSNSKDGGADRKDIFFTPTTNNTLHNGEVKFLFAGKNLYEIDGSYKEILAETSNKTKFNHSKFSLGLKIDSLVDILDGLSLFFSFKNIQDEDSFYESLHSAKWKINGSDVQFRKGLESDSSDDKNSLTELIKKDNNISYKTCSFINDFYSRKFMTLEKGNYRLNNFTKDNGDSHVMSAFFQDEKLKIFGKEILWVEVELSQPISEDEINDLVVSMNCFPVINRELNEHSHTIVKGINVIPLFTDDLFLDMQRVSDSEDEVFLPKTSISNNGDSIKTYVVRQGGITRFDSRDAREMISHLVSLVRDEASAFSAKGSDLISSELKQLDQILSRLQQRINSSEITEDLNSYLTLESKARYDKIHVQFWSVAGDIANNIRMGSKLSVARGVDLDDKSVTLVTQTVGGRQKLNSEDKLNTLRRSMLSKGKIVTIEDIKALCFEQFGSNLKSVDVKKGVRLEPVSGKGMSRTLDVFLVLVKSSKLSVEDVKHKVDELKIRLIQNSINLLPYRVFTEKSFE